MRSRQLIWVVAVVLAGIAVFQIFFRYEIRETATGELLQIDRLTGRQEIIEFSSVGKPRLRQDF